MSISRTIGNNISLHLKNKSMDISTLAEGIEFSLSDTHKMIKGRLLIPPYALKQIANILDVTKEELIKCCDREEYDKLVHDDCNFINSENQEFILDLIDSYVDLVEGG